MKITWVNLRENEKGASKRESEKGVHKRNERRHTVKAEFHYRLERACVPERGEEDKRRQRGIS